MEKTADGNDRLFLQIAKNRAKAGRLVAGVAAASNSDMFKCRVEAAKPRAKCWDTHFSQESKGRPICILKQAAKYLKDPNMISLGGGLPSSENFPYSEISFTVPRPPHFLEEESLAGGMGTAQTVAIGKYDAKAGASEYDISIGLNYGQATGSPQMMRFITEHTELVHNPPYADWQVCQTFGSTGALEQTFRMLCDSARNDSILTEEYSFSTALETLRPQGIKAFGVQADVEGLLPESMDAILSNWDECARRARKPHVLYTVPSGQNPTGSTQSVEHRAAVYSVCQKHELYIVEDEPYYFIQMPPYQPNKNLRTSQPAEDVGRYLSDLVPSYLSLDVDGRVLRMDSFSKVLVPGSRLGWITASAQVIERYIRHAEVANQGPSGFTQLMLWKLLDETWGHEGYLKWLIALKNSYAVRRDMLVDACNQYLPTAVVSWIPPVAGMFLWLNLEHSKHPASSKKPIEDIEEDIFARAIAKGVLCARGSWFRTEPDTPASGLFLRVTFASASQETMAEAIQRLGTAICESYGIQLVMADP